MKRLYLQAEWSGINPQPSPDSEIYQRRLAGPLYYDKHGIEYQEIQSRD